VKAVFLTLILAFAISYQPLPAVSAQAEQDTPEAVAKAYIAATQTADWAKAASFMHPDSLAQVKKMFEPIFAQEKELKAVGPLFGVKSRAEFDQVSGAQVFEKLMSEYGRMVAGFDKLMSKPSFEIVGQVAETPDLVHLVYRAQKPLYGYGLHTTGFTNYVTYTKLEVMTLKRYESAWRLTLPSEFEMMAQLLANIDAAAAAAPAEEGKGAPRKAPSAPAKARKPVRKP
jgi:hypothetical protein